MNEQPEKNNEFVLSKTRGLVAGGPATGSSQLQFENVIGLDKTSKRFKEITTRFYVAVLRLQCMALAYVLNSRL